MLTQAHAGYFNPDVITKGYPALGKTDAGPRFAAPLHRVGRAP